MAFTVRAIVTAFATIFVGTRLVGAIPASAWKRRSVYEIVTDRFALEFGHADTCNVEQCPFTGYCGGTFKGIVEKLDYIQGMGFDAISISPINDNVECGYHGFWTRRFHEINERLGGESGFIELCQALHKRSMVIMVDVVFNHVGPSANKSFADYVPFNSEKYFHGSFDNHCRTDNPEMGDQHQREVCWNDFPGMQLPDLRTEDEAVQTELIKWAERLIQPPFSVDGFHLDMVPFMNKTFLQRLKKGVFKDTYIVGQVHVAGEPLEYEVSYQYTSSSMVGDAIADGVFGNILDGVRNYALWGDMHEIFHDPVKGTKRTELNTLVSNWLTWESVFVDVGSCLNFVDIYSKPRFLLKSNPNSYRNALVVAFFLPGVPTCYYGSEQDMVGGKEDYMARAPFWRNAEYDYYQDMYQWTRRVVYGRKFMLEYLSDSNIDIVRNLIATKLFISFQRGSVVVILDRSMAPYEVEVIVNIPTDLKPGRVVCDTLQPEYMSFEHCATVGAGGLLRLGLNGSPRVLLAPGETMPSMGFTFLAIDHALLPLWFLPLILSFVAGRMQKRMIRIVDPVPVSLLDEETAKIPIKEDARLVLHASIEHVIQTRQGSLKVVAGGLGKVMGLMCQHHPGNIVCVHPCMNGKDYSFASPDRVVHATVSGELITCKVLKYERPDIDGMPRVTFYLVDSSVFREKKGIYPTTMTQRSDLEFFSVWNQCVAMLLDRLKPDIFHCPDFHSGMAMMYVKRPLPVVVTLHNADYQGSITTQQMGWKEAEWLADIFHLDANRIKRECFIDGTFNMLKPAVEYVKSYQGGYGVCCVSRNYAEEARQRHSLFWELPELRGIDNCMPETERMNSLESHGPTDEEEYRRKKREAKLAIQREFKLNENPDARMFVFLGRWVKQKGMDIIADVTEWMLETHENSQLIMIGPVGDSYGSYTRMRMEGLMQNNRFEGRLFAYAGFLAVPPDLKLACDFCLMPSRDEPFGYVDIEFAWFGAAVLGSFRGGLGKLPGFYYLIHDSNSAQHVQESLKHAITAAMECESSILERMSINARRSSFPVETWREELRQLYAVSSQSFKSRQTKRMAKDMRTITLGMDTNKTPLLKGGSSHDRQVGPRDKASASSGLGGRLAPILSCGNFEQLGDAPAGAQSSETGEEDGVQLPVGLGDFRKNSFPLGLTGAEEADDRSQEAVSVISVETAGQYGKTPKFTRQISNMEGHTDGMSGTWSRRSTPSSEDTSHLADLFLHREAQDEFLRQEAHEEAVQGFVEAKAAISTFTKQSTRHAQVLLDETQWELELAREADQYTFFLGKSLGGTPIIDWLISLIYITGPSVNAILTQLVTLHMPMEPITHSFMFNELVSESLSVFFWTMCSMYVPPHKLMAIANLSRLVLLFLPFIVRWPQFVAWVLGFVSAGDAVFIFFNFMGQSIGDVSTLSVRIGLMLAARRASKCIFPTTDVIGVSTGLHISLAILAVCFTLATPLALLKAPSCYRDFRLPNFFPQVLALLRVRVLKLLFVSAMMNGFNHAPAAVFMLWRAAEPTDFVDIRFMVPLAVFGGPMLMALALQACPNSSVVIVKAFAFFSFPGVFLRCRPVIGNFIAFGRVHGMLDFWSLLSVLLDSAYQMAQAVAIQSTSGSRWRFIVFTCLMMAATSASEAASLKILQAMVGARDLNVLGAFEDNELATNVFFSAMIPCLVDMICRTMAFFRFDKESSSMLWTRRMTLTVRALQNSGKPTEPEHEP
eukprot:TRINITY_DN25337_c0_g1_i1.p1 TRINITY_DN25337_c0_g1~~TRINITY_DN25337_c0_g1_i1.p1  ORF type:complete len:1790 (+),score=277.13 TRINITY_DN25337_c0_g1_i1:180-5372(+)